MTSAPILYSYRRCPYAMRARMALRYAGINVEIREIELRNKPAHMLELSPKATVPVLLLNTGEVLEQSLDIIRWALLGNDLEDWLCSGDTLVMQEMEALIERNDGHFKHALDRFKYADRYPEYGQEHYRMQGEEFLQLLEQRLLTANYLFGNRCSMADIAIFPFVRQFAGVDPAWFTKAPYPCLKRWLEGHVSSELFQEIMKKNPVWEDSIASSHTGFSGRYSEIT